MIFLLFVYIKTFFKKNALYIYKWKLQRLPSAKDNVHVYIYTKSKKTAKHFYVQKARHFTKSKTISVTFLYTKIMKLYVTRFSMKFLKVGIYIQTVWKFALSDVFICKKPDTSQKARQFALSFIYKKPDTLRYTIFY